MSYIASVTSVNTVSDQIWKKERKMDNGIFGKLHIHLCLFNSPSLHLGLDLKDDLSRFQIITKVPYPSLGDRWIDEKRKRSEQWYTWQTALRLVQGYGRSIRSKDDWATTYVLDSAFGPFVRRNKNILPDWFTYAIQPDHLRTSWI
jgi:Rad3-related DNA helicase